MAIEIAARALSDAMTDSWGPFDGPAALWDAPAEKVDALRTALKETA